MFLLDLSQPSPPHPHYYDLYNLFPSKWPFTNARTHTPYQKLQSSQPPTPSVLAQLSQFVGAGAGCCLGHRTQDMCLNCCYNPENFPTWACDFFHDWQFLSVLNWFLCDHLLIHLDILCLGTRHPSPPTSPLTSPLSLMWLTTAIL